MELVANEWLPEYFKPDATNDEKQKLVIVGRLTNNLFSKLIKWHEAKIMTLAG